MRMMGISSLKACWEIHRVTERSHATDHFRLQRYSRLRRERIEAAVIAGGRHQPNLYEAWIATDPFRGETRVIITGPHGFERRVAFATDEEASEITRRVRETIEDEF
jgi:hypothetical protein